MVELFYEVVTMTNAIEGLPDLREREDRIIVVVVSYSRMND
jgi:hypothetical protein